MSFFGGHYFAPEERLAAAHANEAAAANGMPGGGAGPGAAEMFHRDMLLQERMAQQAQQAMALQGMAQMAQLGMQTNPKEAKKPEQQLQAPMGFFGQTSPLVEQRIREQLAYQGLVNRIHASLNPPMQQGPQFTPLTPAPGDPYMNNAADPFSGGGGQ